MKHVTAIRFTDRTLRMRVDGVPYAQDVESVFRQNAREGVRRRR